MNILHDIDALENAVLGVSKHPIYSDWSEFLFQSLADYEYEFHGRAPTEMRVSPRVRSFIWSSCRAADFQQTISGDYLWCGLRVHVSEYVPDDMVVFLVHNTTEATLFSVTIPENLLK